MSGGSRRGGAPTQACADEGEGRGRVRDRREEAGQRTSPSSPRSGRRESRRGSEGVRSVLRGEGEGTKDGRAGSVRGRGVGRCRKATSRSARYTKSEKERDMKRRTY